MNRVEENQEMIVHFAKSAMETGNGTYEERRKRKMQLWEAYWILTFPNSYSDKQVEEAKELVKPVSIQKEVSSNEVDKQMFTN